MGKRMCIRRILGHMATLCVVGSLLCGGIAVAAQDGGGGSSTAPDGTGGYTSKVVWAAKDNFGLATESTVRSVLEGPLDGHLLDDELTRTSIKEATTEARKECETNYAKRHDGNTSDADCRVFAVGSVRTDQDKTIANASGNHSQSEWLDVWENETSGKKYSHEGKKYTTSFKLGNGETINGIARRETVRASDKNLVVIMLASDEPVDLETPPAAPSKKVQKGVSADDMTNTTQISSGTGVGGTKMVFTDTINAHGMKYKVMNQTVTDKTSGDNVTSKFTFSTANGKAVASWKGGSLPDNHVFVYSLDIVVDNPGVNTVEDTATVKWNDEPAVETGKKEFPTWSFTPNKAWVKYVNGQWVTVTDKDFTNAKGADNATFLDGDKVGSAVNTTVAADLIEAPTHFAIIDDYTKADYIFDADSKDIHVYAKDTSDDVHATVNNMASVGKNVTSDFDITVKGTTVTATMKKAKLSSLKGMSTAKQYTLVIGGRANYANGQGAAQVRHDAKVATGESVSFCADPTKGGVNDSAHALTNAASVAVNADVKKTNEPKICGFVPHVHKDVVSESSQSGTQESIDGKIVFKGEKIEYVLQSDNKIPNTLGYEVERVQIVDQYDKNFAPDKQTLEITDLTTGRIVPKSQYAAQWNESKHKVTVTFSKAYINAHYKNGSVVRFVARFEGTMTRDDKDIVNEWKLVLNQSSTVSNKVKNIPPDFTPTKEDTQKDASINIDGKTAMLGDTIYYRVKLDAKMTNTSYKVWRLGMVDDYDDQYLQADEQNIEILDETGRDVTSQFNIQLKDGVVYAFAKTVDTAIPATGETVKGNPQPADLKAYSMKGYKPLEDPVIDQKLLGHTYTVIMPMTVKKVTDGYVAKNKAAQLVNNMWKMTNEVANPLKEINPHKDVTVVVDGKSRDKGEITLNSVFLYRLDSSMLPTQRAYPTVTDWSITDKFDTKHDKYTGQWAVYAQADITAEDGTLLAKKGERIAGSHFTSDKFGELFTAEYKNGVFTVKATDEYLKMVTEGRAGMWTAWVQCQRIATSDKVENTLTETVNKVERKSNTVWTKTPDQTPRLHLEKFDEKSGLKLGDRDKVEQALEINKGDKLTIVFRITNTGNVDLKHLTLSDSTIAGNGTVTDFVYPAGWDALVLKPGQSVDVKGTFHGMTKDNHTNRAVVTGKPIVPCPSRDDDPFDGKEPDTPEGQMCEQDKPVVSNTDDWNAKAKPDVAKFTPQSAKVTTEPKAPTVASLARTGITVVSLSMLALITACAGIALKLRFHMIRVHSGKHAQR